SSGSRSRSCCRRCRVCVWTPSASPSSPASPSARPRSSTSAGTREASAMLDPATISSAAAHVAGNVRLLRARQGLSLGQLAARADMSKGTLSKLETGAANPTLETLATLAAALSVPLHELFAAPHAGIEVVRAGEGLELGETPAGARLVHVLSR